MSYDLVDYALELTAKSGCEYSEARFQRTSDVVCFTRNGNPEPAVIADAEGIDARIIYDGALSFGATNIMSRESVKEMV